MDSSNLLQAWWMPSDEVYLWQVAQITAIQKVIFLTGILSIFNSIAHSVVRIFFDKTHFSPEDSVWLPHRIVEFFYSTFIFLYSLALFISWDETDNTFVKGRVFAFSLPQEFLSNLHSAYAIYSIGISLLNFKGFRRKHLFMNVSKGAILLGMNYLHLLFPCVLASRIRIYWNLLEIAMSVTVFTHLARHLDAPIKTTAILGIVSIVLVLVRFWMTIATLFWAYGWASSENIWSEIPIEVPVAKTANAYLTVTSLGAVGWTYLAFLDFRQVIELTKEWSQKFKKPENEASTSSETEPSETKNKSD